MKITSYLNGCIGRFFSSFPNIINNILKIDDLRKYGEVVSSGAA
jgi:hypothetical protein